ncbi:MAG TPA: polysaccharide deacetylase family protein [Steroidobacteraceae bacterium]|jgi:peptidoglycan/xylan/chitin deacetylase (PgdA/CDA1 family)|nr:polysaccharide deacetylase family protein [Steroidobacteraceae bacterium]
MFIRSERFESRLNILRRRNIRVVSLDEGLRNRTSGQTRAVITFDDGWASNLSLALPILKKYHYPACVYVTTEHLEATPEVFNVVLLYLLLKSERATLNLLGLDPALDGTYDLSKDRHKIAQNLAERAEGAIPQLSNRQLLLRPIADALGVSLQEALKNDRFRLLRRDELKELGEQEGIDIGLHTHTHRLPDSTFEAMASEIERNRQALQNATQRDAHHFCYPSGLYSTQHPQWLRALGIQSATTCVPGLNGSNDSVMLLKRYLDNDCTSDLVFEAQVAGIHDLLQRLRRLLGG